MKKFLAPLALLAILLGLELLISPHVSKKMNAGTSVTFVCSHGKSIDSTFYKANDTHVDLSLSDGRNFSVPHAVSASGARYATPDESFVFWNKGDTAFIEEGGVQTYSGCVLLSVGESISPDPMNATYLIEGEKISFINGVARKEIPNSSSIIETRFFGDPVFADVDGDGVSDAIMIIVQSGGGSGTFFYVGAARGVQGGYLGTNMIFLGDRISPQNINFLDGVINVNFAERAAGDPMTDSPSVGVTKRLMLRGGALIEA